MSAFYSFDMSTKLAPESLMRTFLLSLGLPRDAGDKCDVGTPHFHASAGQLRKDSIDHLQGLLGFRPDVSFLFRTWAAAGIEAKAEIVRGTLAICQAVAGDAVLLFNGEVVLYMRKAGTLYVNAAYWRGDYSLFSPPYELKEYSTL